jgi:glutathione S-transferase
MKLYTTPIAPNPRRVRWVLAEKGVTDVEHVTINLIEGEHRRDDYLAKAGLPMVPALELEDGGCLTESVAICRFIESRHPEPNLFGRDPLEVAQIEMWMRRGEMLAATPLMMAVLHTHPAFSALRDPDPVVGEHYRKSGEKGLTVLDRRLADSEWIAGERITIADIVAFTGLDFARLIKVKPGDDLPSLQRWVEAMRARPGASA